MRVKMLDTVEDANEFDRSDPLAGRQPFTINIRPYGSSIVRRVDKLWLGEAYNLPKAQAEKLIAIKVAEAA